MIHVPYLAGTFMADHAGTDRVSWGTNLPVEFAVRWRCDSSQHFITDTGRVLADVFEDNPKFFLGILLLEIFFQP